MHHTTLSCSPYNALHSPSILTWHIMTSDYIRQRRMCIHAHHNVPAICCLRGAYNYDAVINHVKMGTLGYPHLRGMYIFMTSNLLIISFSSAARTAIEFNTIIFYYFCALTTSDKCGVYRNAIYSKRVSICCTCSK